MHPCCSIFIWRFSKRIRKRYILLLWRHLVGYICSLMDFLNRSGFFCSIKPSVEDCMEHVLKWPRKLCDRGQTNLWWSVKSLVCKTLLHLVFEMTMSKKKNKKKNNTSLSLLLGATYIFSQEASSCLINLFIHVKFCVWLDLVSEVTLAASYMDVLDYSRGGL